ALDRTELTILTGPVVLVPRPPAPPLRDAVGDRKQSSGRTPASNPTLPFLIPEAAIGPERIEPGKEASERQQIEIQKPVSTVSTPPTPPSLAQERQVAATPPIATTLPAAVVTSPETRALHGADRPAPQAASPLGLGGRLMVFLDRPRSNMTDEATLS